MLKTNLSTRPFYNVRAVRFALGLCVLFVLVISLANATMAFNLFTTERSLGARASEAEEQADRLRSEAVEIRAQINPSELGVVATAAREANGIIDQRAFSWTRLFSEFERALPSDVRIMSVQPQLERDGTFTVSVAVQARQVEDLDAFLEALETQQTFRNVLSASERTTEQDLIEARVVGIYVPQGRNPEPSGAGQ